MGSSKFALSPRNARILGISFPKKSHFAPTPSISLLDAILLLPQFGQTLRRRRLPTAEQFAASICLLLRAFRGTFARFPTSIRVFVKAKIRILGCVWGGGVGWVWGWGGAHVETLLDRPIRVRWKSLVRGVLREVSNLP